MSFRLIGFEGAVSADAVAVWGVAAIERDGLVLNALTQRTLSLGTAEELRSDGHIHLLEHAVELDDKHAASPLIVAMVNLRSPLSYLFLVEREKTAGLAGAYHDDAQQIYVFEDRSAFDVYARNVSVAVLKDVLYSPDTSGHVAIARHQNAVRNALGLLPSSPDLNALRVFLTATPTAGTFARASLRGDFEIARFERLLRALQRSTRNEAYELKYERGAAEGGGLDADVAGNTLHAVSRASKVLDGQIRETFPYLRPGPSPRLYKMEAASAHMYFVPQARENETLGERVGRYLALELLENAVEGRVEVSDTKKQRTLDAAVDKIVRPTPQTSLRHKRLEEEQLSPVQAAEADTAEPVRSERLDLLAVISGLRRDSEAELQFAPNLRVTVSTNDDGDGNMPDGADTIRRDRKFLRRLCLASVIRVHTPGSKAKFLLRRLRLIEAGETVAVSALPSSVVRGAFMVGLRMRLQLSSRAHSLTGPIGEIEVDNSGALDGARQFIVNFAKAAALYELDHADRGRWIRSPKVEDAAPLDRIIVVLHFKDGTANVSAIRTLVERRFGRAVRGNNTRREVLRNPELLEFDTADPQLVRLTARGRRYYTAFVAAGGATQKLDQAKVQLPAG